MKAVRTRQLREAPFAFDKWVTNGGLAVVAEADPTTLASVPANRIITIRPKRGCAVIHGGFLAIRGIVYDGTNASTLVFQAWYFEDTLGIWIKNAQSITLTVGAANVALTVVGNLMGAKFYVQVVSNAAGCTAFGYDEF